MLRSPHLGGKGCTRSVGGPVVGPRLTEGILTGMSLDLMFLLYQTKEKKTVVRRGRTIAEIVQLIRTTEPDVLKFCRPEILRNKKRPVVNRALLSE